MGSLRKLKGGGSEKGKGCLRSSKGREGVLAPVAEEKNRGGRILAVLRQGDAGGSWGTNYRIIAIRQKKSKRGDQEAFNGRRPRPKGSEKGKRPLRRGKFLGLKEAVIRAAS